MSTVRNTSFFLLVALLSTSAAWGVYTVNVGASNLIATLDYSDTFTTGVNGRTNTTNFGTAGPQLTVENSHGNPARSWSTITAVPYYFRDTNRANTTDPNPMADTGMLESGPGYGPFTTNMNYGLRNRFVIQFDLIPCSDRVDVQIGGLSLFIRFCGHPSPELGVYVPGPGETSAGFSFWACTVVDWHNAAFICDVDAKTIDCYTDEIFDGQIDLKTFAGGVYQAALTNSSVGIGAGSAGIAASLDNFQIGVPCEPIAHNSSPTNGAVSVPLTANLSWQTGCAPGNPITQHNVIFTTSAAAAANPATTPSATLAVGTTTWDPPGDLTPLTTYYWRIDEMQGATQNVGAVWSFTTVGTPPHDPTPANTATGVSVTPTLSWLAGVGGPFTYNVYLGASQPLGAGDRVSTGQSGLSFAVTTPRLYNTTYYWRVDALQGQNTYASDTWSFQTIVPTCTPRPAGDIAPAPNGDCKVDLLDFAVVASQWLACNLDPAAACN